MCLRVGFDAPLRDDEPLEHASGHPEDTLLGIELDSFRLETSECHFKVGEEVGSLPCLDYDVIAIPFFCRLFRASANSSAVVAPKRLIRI